MHGKSMLPFTGKVRMSSSADTLTDLSGNRFWNDHARTPFSRSPRHPEAQSDLGSPDAAVGPFHDLTPWTHRLYLPLRRESAYIAPLEAGPDNVPNRQPNFFDNVNNSIRRLNERRLRSLLRYGYAISMARSIEVRLHYSYFRFVEPGFDRAGAQGKWHPGQGNFSRWILHVIT